MNQWKIDMFKHCHLFCFLLASVCLHLTARAQVLPLTAEMRAMIGKSYKIVEQKIEDADPDDEHAAKAIVVPDLKGWRFHEGEYGLDRSNREGRCNTSFAVKGFYDGIAMYDSIDNPNRILGKNPHFIDCLTAYKNDLKIYLIVRFFDDKKITQITDILNVNKIYKSESARVVKIKKKTEYDEIEDNDYVRLYRETISFMFYENADICDKYFVRQSQYPKRFYQYNVLSGKFGRAQAKNNNHEFYIDQRPSFCT